MCLLVSMTTTALNPHDCGRKRLRSGGLKLRSTLIPTAASNDPSQDLFHLQDREQLVPGCKAKFDPTLLQVGSFTDFNLSILKLAFTFLLILSLSLSQLSISLSLPYVSPTCFLYPPLPPFSHTYSLSHTLSITLALKRLHTHSISHSQS